jgi:putative hemolysin
LSGLLFKIAFIISSAFVGFQIAPDFMHSFLGVITFLFLEIISIMVFMIILPRTIANLNPERCISFTFPIIQPVLFCLGPFGNAFSSTTNVFARSFVSGNATISVNDLSNVIDRKKEKYSDDEEILKGIIKFGSIDVSDILKPRIDVVAIELDMSLNQVLLVVVESGYSRIPVYEGNFDNVKGILYVKDLLPFINENDTFRWQTLIRPPYFIPDTKKVKELLTEFQTSKNHMAVIVDEYGGTLGIVTLEDILEEIVGEISDESDEEEKQYVQINTNTYIFDGKILLNDFHKILQTESDIFDDIKGDAETLAGLILELKGEIPAKNEQIKIQQFTFKIEAADSRRIKQIRVTIDENEKQ